MIYRKRMIWVDEVYKEDSYAEFIAHFRSGANGDVSLRIAADSYFAVYLNGTLVHFGASADYPWYKLYHEVDITENCVENNALCIMVWYHGRESQTYIKDEPGLWFEVEQNGKVLTESNEDTLSRINLNYKNEYCKIITSQLGFSFYYDNTIQNVLPFTPSIESKKEQNFHRRKTGYLQLGGRVPLEYTETSDGYLVDLKEEVVGFLELEFDSEEEQEILVSYGEHLVDGHVPRMIGERDFSVEFKACRGKNVYLNPFRRLAGRYLQVFCDKPLDIKYIGLRPTDRIVEEVDRKFHDSCLQNIYDVSVNTLKKCMHEHYEDCPWREQAMYTLDSRNQMLCSYYAFRDIEYVRDNLFFIAQGQREDGLLSLCFPAGIDIPIPSFSLVYMMQIADYVEHTKDMDTALELKPVVDRIYRAFCDKIDENGLIPNFPYPYWNFYEWSQGSHNESEVGRTSETPYIKQYDLILNCMYIYFCKLYEKIYGKVLLNDEMLHTIRDTFYDNKSGLYKLSTNGEIFSQLGNSFAVLIGLGTKELVRKMIHDDSLVEVTLSMNTFYYDALLSCGNEYKDFIIQDIRKKYGYMLDAGATTFWETAKGWRDFDGAGSLCHGWSAIPVYYLSKLIEE